MSSYDDKELSAQDSAPVMLYQFAQGATVWRYTTAGQAISRSGYTWNPEAIVASGFGSHGDLNKDQLSLQLPKANTVAALFLGGFPELVTSVTVFRTHADDTEVRLYWKGTVAGAPASGSIVTLVCDPITVAMKRLGLRQTYQRSCPHELFGPGCQLDENDFVTELTVTAIVDARTINVSGSGAVDGLVGGELRAPSGTGSEIIDRSLDILTLLLPIPSLAVGQTVKLFPGCDHSYEMCGTRFGNQGNHGGYKGLTGIQPMGTGSSIF